MASITRNVIILVTVIGVVVTGYLYAIHVFAYSYPPRWASDGDARTHWVRDGDPPSLEPGDFRLSVLPSFAPRVSIRIVNDGNDGATVFVQRAAQFATHLDASSQSEIGHPIDAKYERSLAVAEYDHIVRALYRTGAIAEKPCIGITTLDGRPVVFEANISDQYVWCVTNEPSDAINRVEQLFREVCGTPCLHGIFGEED